MRQLVTSIVVLVLLGNPNTSASALDRPPFPVILIHGWNGNADTWAALTENLRRNSWIAGGTAFLDGRDTVINARQLRDGDYYVMQFSDNKNLGFEQQATQLRELIRVALERIPTPGVGFSTP